MAFSFFFVFFLCPFLVTSLPSKFHETKIAPSLFATTTPIISTCNGPIRGFQENGVNKYLGIPYAEPPIGNNRWKATIPKRSWTTILNATTFRAQCLQPVSQNLFGLPTSEDCLYLNIWTPSGVRENSNLPVLFWIHGGGYIGGSASWPSFDGSDLASKSNIVVTIDYRLGIFGFFGLPQLRAEDPHQSVGNYGINDMQVALKWVQENIRLFGGDPTKVTIWGQSAGASAVLSLLASRQSRGLFARAIADSRAFEKLTNTLDYVYSEGNYIANVTNCLHSSRGVLSCLRAQSGDSLINLFNPCTISDTLPTIDNYQFTDDPYNLIGTTQFLKVPLIIGTNKDEGTLLLTFSFPLNLTADQYPDAVTTLALQRGYQSSDISTILSLYPLSNYTSPYWALSDFYGDSLIICPNYRWLKKYAQFYPTTQLYSYSVTYNQSSAFGFSLGATHGVELDWVFQAPIPFFTSPANSAILQDEVQTYWRAFIKNGNVNSLNNGNMINWPLYKNPGTQQNIVFDLSLGTSRNFGVETKCNSLLALRQGPYTPSCHL